MVNKSILLATLVAALASASPLGARQDATSVAASATSDAGASASASATDSAGAAAAASTTAAAAAASAASNSTAAASGGSGGGADAAKILASVSVSGQFAKPSVSPTDGASAAQNPDAYTFFKGDGSKGAGWPTQDQWINFNDMFDRNSKVMGQGCTAGVTPTTTDEIDTIKSAIQSVASAAAIDPRFVLATVMQESNGCVRVPGTPSGEAGVFNPGLMQSFKGTGTCNVNNTQQINPCPPDQITQMIVDGTQGVNTPDASGKDALQGGLVQQINAQTTADANGQIYYKAARAYNSGAISADGVLETAGQCGPPRTFGVPCYSSDIANRMMGWVSAPTGCDLKPAASC